MWIISTSLNDFVYGRVGIYLEHSAPESSSSPEHWPFGDLLGDGQLGCTSSKVEEYSRTNLIRASMLVGPSTTSEYDAKQCKTL